MKKYNTLSMFLTVLIIISFGILLYGCGASPTSSVDDAAASPANNGAITGNTYDYIQATKTFTPTNDVIVSVSTSDGVNIASVQVATSGAFSISGLPAGTIAVTFTQESNAVPLTLVANSSIFKTYINYVNASSVTGTATVCGSFLSAPVTPTVVSLRVSPLSEKDFTGENQTIYMTQLTYEASEAPDDGTLYVRVYFQVSVPTLKRYYAYNRVTTSPNSIVTCDLTLNNFKTIEATLLSPSGYYIERLRSYVANGYKTTVSLATCLSTEASGNLYTLNYLPTMLSGDSYYLELTAKTGLGETLYRYYYDRSDGPQTIDLSTLSYPADVSIKPASGEGLTSTPTFEWNAVPGATYYVVVVMDGGSVRWNCLTKSTSITMPKIIYDSLPLSATYSYYILAQMVISDVNVNDLTLINNWISSGMLSSRTKTFSK